MYLKAPKMKARVALCKLILIQQDVCCNALVHVIIFCHQCSCASPVPEGIKF